MSRNRLSSQSESRDENFAPMKEFKKDKCHLCKKLGTLSERLPKT